MATPPSSFGSFHLRTGSSVTWLMFAFLFSCCGRPRIQPDERTPLIPHADDTPTPQPRVIDHQKLKERLGSVVRSKEGKMVNVNAQFPFNLHNHGNPEHPSSLSSRNVSGGTFHSSRSPSPSHQLHKSRSNASFRPDGEDLVQYLPLALSSPAQVLNVRLVKPARTMHSARGRPQRPNCRTPPLELAPDEEHTPRAHPPPSSLEQPTHLPVHSETPPHHPEEFSIHDAGAVARSWGD